MSKSAHFQTQKPEETFLSNRCKPHTQTGTTGRGQTTETKKCLRLDFTFQSGDTMIVTFIKACGLADERF